MLGTERGKGFMYAMQAFHQLSCILCPHIYILKISLGLEMQLRGKRTCCSSRVGRFLAPTMGVSRLSVIPALGNPMPSSDFHGHTHKHADTHRDTDKYTLSK